MHLALIKYSVLRLALFVGSLILLYLVGVRQSILMLVLAAGVSLTLSYLLLTKPRNELAQALTDRTEARLRRKEQERAAGIPGTSAEDEEDAAVEAAERARVQQAQLAPGQVVVPEQGQPQLAEPGAENR